MKRLACLLLVCIMVFSFGITASAAVKDEVSPLYTYVSSVYADLSINTNTGVVTCTGSVCSKRSAPVEVDVALQMYKDGYWQTVQSWTSSGTLYTQVSKNYAVYSGYEYRTYVVGYVYNTAGTMIVESATASYSVNYPKK